MTADRVSIVVATRNRSAIAYTKAQWALVQKECIEAIFVVDGAEDDTAARLSHLAETDARLRVVVLPRQSGLPGARNAGIRVATGDWVLLIDDDDTASEGMLGAMLATAQAAKASIVGAPWFNLTGGQDVATFIEQAPRRPGGPALERPGIFPQQEWEECLWLPANALFRRSLFDDVHFDEGYRINFYREDTDFMVSSARAGHRVVVTSGAYTYLRQRVGGGVERRSRLRYEYWALRNNWRFLRKHGRWLRERGDLRGPVREQIAFAVRRARPLLRSAGRRLIRVH